MIIINMFYTSYCASGDFCSATKGIRKKTVWRTPTRILHTMLPNHSQPRRASQTKEPRFQCASKNSRCAFANGMQPIERSTTMSKQELLKKMSDDVLDMEEEDIIDDARDYLAEGHDPQEGILQGLVDGMRRASEMYENGEYFVPELINCSDAMYAGMDVLLDAMPDSGSHIGKAILGVVEGDTHDIGKSLVKVMLETAGIEVIDLGRDVPVERFVECVRENEDARLLCMSSLMTTTMQGMETVIKRLEEENLRDQVKVMVGGAPISQGFAKRIGADLYTPNAIVASNEAVKLIESVR